VYHFTLEYPEPVFQGKKSGIKPSQGSTEFFHFGCGAVNLKPGKFGQLQRLLQQRSHILQMGQQSLRICVPLPAMGQITVETDTVIEASGLCAGAFNEPLAQLLELCQVFLPTKK
jgi:hypothetical protein